MNGTAVITMLRSVWLGQTARRRAGVTGMAAAVAIFMVWLVLVLSLGSRAAWQKTGTITMTGLLIFFAATRWQAVLSSSRSAGVQSRAVANDFRRLDPAELYVVWGGALPWKLVYPVIPRQATWRTIRFNGFGVSTLAPFVVSGWESTKWPDFLARLADAQGVPLIATQTSLDLLRTYCAEHRRGEWKIHHVNKYTSFTVTYVSCAP
jgi:hypothetical protein